MRVDIRSTFLARRKRWIPCDISARQRPMFRCRQLASWRPQQPWCFHVVRRTDRTRLVLLQGSPDQLGGDDVTRLDILEVRRRTDESSCVASLRAYDQDHISKRWKIAAMFTFSSSSSIATAACAHSLISIVDVDPDFCSENIDYNSCTSGTIQF